MLRSSPPGVPICRSPKRRSRHFIGWAIPVQRFDDIGVAGPQRFLSAIPRIQQASAVVVIAGMEGALPSAIGGHLSAPVFAVPTSVGYGATFGGIAPLLGMLSSCASNVAVVNIDAGFKAPTWPAWWFDKCETCYGTGNERQSLRCYCHRGQPMLTRELSVKSCWWAGHAA